MSHGPSLAEQRAAGRTPDALQAKALGLRFPLKANAVFSFASGLTMLLWSAELSELATVGPDFSYQAVGACLLVFALMLLKASVRPTPIQVLAFVGADMAWIIGTTLGGLLLIGELSLYGWLALAAVNATVGVLAYLQYRSILAYFSAPAGSRERFRLCLHVDVSVRPEALWPVVSNLGAIKNYVPTLRSSALTVGDRPGTGCVRTCESSSGSKWSERCDHWVENESFEMTFLTEETGFPFPFSLMRGGWQVRPQAAGSYVEIWWQVTPRIAAGAGLLLPMMQTRLAKDMAKVVANMASASSHLAERGTSNRIKTLVPC
ncbi:hypothetical protein GGR20_002519 [Devosia subaequoris]|uniref:SRPBCC family protein n=1 Tax=Devosia subaequoris TaxID=395930 RepID=A0A7W6NCM9_9HYPH|nr:SRPBCC family protein [Devosia subaequoris]MBB4052871.1 hypothetical protein [Devosia subaequoris]MCP1210022.1 SRPBCC family protein [Devosia subaequoris]